MLSQTRAQAKQQNQSSDMSIINDNNGNASVSIFAPILAPILRSTNPTEIAKFLKDRER